MKKLFLTFSILLMFCVTILGQHSHYTLPQSPWIMNIDGNNKTLTNATAIYIIDWPVGSNQVVHKAYVDLADSNLYDSIVGVLGTGYVTRTGSLGANIQTTPDVLGTFGTNILFFVNTNNVSFGYNILEGGKAVALGYNINALTNGVGIGKVVTAYDFGVGIGIGAQGQVKGVGIGYNATGQDNGVAIGNAAAGNNQGVGIGEFADGTGQGCVSIGWDAVIDSGGGNFTNTIQLGPGDNVNEGSVKCFDWELIQPNGIIHPDRLAGYGLGDVYLAADNAFTGSNSFPSLTLNGEYITSWNDLTNFTGDNLGDHTAEMNLDMAGYNITNISSIIFEDGSIITTGASIHIISDVEIQGSLLVTETIDVKQINVTNLNVENVVSNFYINGWMDMQWNPISNAFIFGDGSGLTNLDIADELANYTPLNDFTNYQIAASNDIADLQTDVAGKLDSNHWADADSTTNYFPRTGGNISGQVIIDSSLIVTNSILTYGDIDIQGNNILEIRQLRAATADEDGLRIIFTKGSEGIGFYESGIMEFTTNNAGENEIQILADLTDFQSTTVTGVGNLYVSGSVNFDDGSNLSEDSDGNLEIDSVSDYTEFSGDSLTNIAYIYVNDDVVISDTKSLNQLYDAFVASSNEFLKTAALEDLSNSVIQAGLEFTNFTTHVTNTFYKNTGGELYGDIELQTNNITQVRSITYIPTNMTGIGSEGTTWWDETERTLSIQTEESSVALHAGQGTWVRVRNESGSTITKGEVVYAAGVTSGTTNLFLIDVASVDDTNTFSILGLVSEEIDDDKNGYVTSLGFLRNSGITSSYNDGDVLYLSTDGSLSDSPGDYEVEICTVINATDGIVYVNPKDAIIPQPSAGIGGLVTNGANNEIVFGVSNANAIVVLTFAEDVGQLMIPMITNQTSTNAHFVVRDSWGVNTNSLEINWILGIQQ
jgi:hypothetical protein